ncbi:DNA-directed RNA polymerase III subunit RPC10 [Dendrobium catenatum]|nr:DNA-directed RNA polymerase III subunit RPC10 [Dendrobium catenatum]
MSMAMEFCPNCAILLELEAASGNRKTRFFCPACPYVCPINVKIVRKGVLVNKEVEPIFGADDMKYAPKTTASCPRCNHGEAYFKQMQIRSADEPMTSFYKCCNESCKFNWRED